jgi:xanthine dehydrogenase accessory factor
MKELLDITNAFDEIVRNGTPAALATVVRVSGSSYRRPGARMLFTDRGRVAGLINAACMQSDLFEKARKVIRNGTSVLISYDTTSPDDILLGLGLGCNGFVEILIEPASTEALKKRMEWLQGCVRAPHASLLATVIRTSESSSLRLGDFVGLDHFGKLSGTLPESVLSATIRSEFAEHLKTGGWSTKIIPLEGGSVESFTEIIQAPVPLIVFGAGSDAIPLMESAKRLGWHVTIVDHRPAMATKQNIPLADTVLLAHPEELRQHLTFHERHVCVIMTHNFNVDAKLLLILLESPVRYVGVLGPRSKLELLLQSLKQEGFEPTDRQRARLHGPIGLDIGAESPEEIALSVVTEIKAVLEGRSGGFLRDRIGAIH